MAEEQEEGGFFNSKGGKIVAGAILLLGLFGIYWSVRGSLGPSEAGKLARERTFICSETGKAFTHTLKEKEMYPVKSPHSGKETGYPAELCYWTRDGSSKQEPTAVLLKATLGEKGPTFCPDCGRLVVFHNPRPKEGSTAPVLEADYKPGRAPTRDN